MSILEMRVLLMIFVLLLCTFMLFFLCSLKLLQCFWFLVANERVIEQLKPKIFVFFKLLYSIEINFGLTRYFSQLFLKICTCLQNLLVSLLAHFKPIKKGFNLFFALLILSFGQNIQPVSFLFRQFFKIFFCSFGFASLHHLVVNIFASKV